MHSGTGKILGAIVAHDTETPSSPLYRARRADLMAGHAGRVNYKALLAGGPSPPSRTASCGSSGATAVAVGLSVGLGIQLGDDRAQRLDHGDSLLRRQHAEK